MDDELIVFLFLACSVVLFLDYFISGWFYTVAKEKGHHELKYFWICFLLGIVGWCLIIALPDRGDILTQTQEKHSHDELPEL